MTPMSVKHSLPWLRSLPKMTRAISQKPVHFNPSIPEVPYRLTSVLCALYSVQSLVHPWTWHVSPKSLIILPRPDGARQAHVHCAMARGCLRHFPVVQTRLSARGHRLRSPLSIAGMNFAESARIRSLRSRNAAHLSNRYILEPKMCSLVTSR